MSVTFIQRSAGKRQTTGSGTISLAAHGSAAAGDIQMLAASCFQGNAVGTPSGTGWLRIHQRTNTYSRLEIWVRVLAAADLAASVDTPIVDWSNVELRTYRCTADERFVISTSGDGLVADDVTVTTWLVRCWASAQNNSSGGSLKTLTPPAGLLNTAATTYNWYDGGLYGDDPTTSGSSGTSTATHTGGTESKSPQWANLLIQVIDLSGVSVTGLSAAGLDTAASVVWDVTNGATSYDYRVDGGSPVNVTTNSASITGLTNGTTYTVEVRPKNSTSTGSWTTVTVTPVPVLLLDDFNRANSTTSLGSAIAGGPYTVRAGTWGINSNRAYTSVSTAESLVTFPAATDVDLQVTFAVLGGHLVLRWVDSSNYWLIGPASGTSGVWTVWRKRAGTFVVAASSGVTAAAGDVVRAIASGRFLYFYANTKMVIAIEDNAFPAATSTCGLRLSSTTTGRFDDLSANPAPINIPGTPDGTSNTALYRGRDTKTADEGNA